MQLAAPVAPAARVLALFGAWDVQKNHISCIQATDGGVFDAGAGFAAVESEVLGCRTVSGCRRLSEAGDHVEAFSAQNHSRRSFIIIIM